MAILRYWDIQWGENWWLSLGFHIDHTDPSITLHLPGLIICMGRCKQPGFKHSLHRLRYTGATHGRGVDEIVAVIKDGWLGKLGIADWSLRQGPSKGGRNPYPTAPRPKRKPRPQPPSAPKNEIISMGTQPRVLPWLQRTRPWPPPPERK